MDAGRVHFVPDAKLDIAHSMGFRRKRPSQVLLTCRAVGPEHAAEMSQELGHLLCGTHYLRKTGQLRLLGSRPVPTTGMCKMRCHSSRHARPMFPFEHGKMQWKASIAALVTWQTSTVVHGLLGFAF